MALINCPECGKKISDKAQKCIHCGYELNSKNSRNDKQGYNFTINKWVILLVVAIPISYIIGSCIIGKKPKQLGAFHDGYAIAILNGKYGYLAQDGKLLTSCIYDSVCDFSMGFGKIYKDNKWGMINKKGEEVLSLSYDSIQDFHEKIAIASLKGKFTLLKSDGTIVDVCNETTENYQFDFKNNLLKINRNGKVGFVDKNGSEVVPFIFDDAKDYDGLGLVIVKKDGKWGFYNCSYIAKTMITPFCFDDIEYIKNSLSHYIVKKDGKYGVLFLTSYTKELLSYEELSYTYPIEATSISGCDDKITICVDGNYCVKTTGYNNEHTYAISNYSYVGNLSQSGFLAVAQNGKIGFLRGSSFEEVIPCIYDNALEVKNSEFIVEKDGLWGVLDRNGEIKLPFKYKKIGYAEYNGLRNVLESGDTYWKYIDYKGHVVCDMPFDYAEGIVCNSRFGGSRVKINGKWNYLIYKESKNPKFSLLDEKGFDECSSFAKIMRVVKDGSTYYIDENGNQVFPNKTNKLLEMFPFSEGLSLARFSGDRYGYINTEGKRVLALYSSAQPFKNGKAIVGRYYINKEGLVVGEYHNPNAKPDPFLESFVSFDPEKARRAAELINRINSRQAINNTIRFMTNGMP